MLRSMNVGASPRSLRGPASKFVHGAMTNCCSGNTWRGLKTSARDLKAKGGAVELAAEPADGPAAAGAVDGPAAASSSSSSSSDATARRTCLGTGSRARRSSSELGTTWL